MLSSLSATITAENYEAMKALLASAKAAYNALSAEEKALLTGNPALLDTVQDAIAAYEAETPTTAEQPTQGENPTTTQEQPTTTEKQPTKESETTTSKKKGCKSSVLASSSFIVLGLSLIAIAIKRRKEQE